MNRDLYNALADLLTYPNENTRPRSVILSEDAAVGERPVVGREQVASESKDLVVQAAIDHRQSAMLFELQAFADSVRALSLHELQELYIRTFDLNPVCSLEMGWHLFGENYDRGLLLVKMRQQMRAHGLTESTELPDHLTHALRLLPLMDRDSASYFAEAIVLPALEKMRSAFKDKINPYEHVLTAARQLLRADFPEITLLVAAAPALPVLA